MRLTANEAVLVSLAAGMVCLGAVWVLSLFIKVTGVRHRSGGDLRCPACGIRDVRTSQQRALNDAIYQRFECAPYRCRMCGIRFYRYQPAKSQPV